MVYCLLVESTMKAQFFHAKLLFQKAMLRQGGAQNVLFIKNGVLPVIALLFWKLSFSVGTSCK